MNSETNDLVMTWQELLEKISLSSRSFPHELLPDRSNIWDDCVLLGAAAETIVECLKDRQNRPSLPAQTLPILKSASGSRKEIQVRVS
jgi:hypothetical protein